MPTYVYRRKDGTTFEVFQSITADPLTSDPDTGDPVERVISGGVGLQFKGSGFYLTDYANKSSSGTETTSTTSSETDSSDTPAATTPAESTSE